MPLTLVFFVAQMMNDRSTSTPEGRLLEDVEVLWPYKAKLIVYLALKRKRLREQGNL